MPHNYCYHSKKSKLIYFEFSSHCLVWLASRLASLHRAEPSLIFWLAKIASRAELGSFTCRAEPSRAELSSARLVSSPSWRRSQGHGLQQWGGCGWRRPQVGGGWRRPRGGGSRRRPQGEGGWRRLRTEAAAGGEGCDDVAQEAGRRRQHRGRDKEEREGRKEKKKGKKKGKKQNRKRRVVWTFYLSYVL